MLDALLMLSAAPASAYMTSFFNIRLEDYKSYPKCDDPTTPPEKICSNPDNLGWTFDLRHPPAWLKGNVIVYVLDNGKVGAAEVYTTGIESQRAVFSELSIRYGKPSTYRSVKAQNGFGATFAVIHASWKLANKATVEMVGAEDRIDEGKVTYLP